MYCIVLYYNIPRSAPPARSPEQGSGERLPPENRKISILGVVDYTILYYIILYYNILYHCQPRSPVRPIAESGGRQPPRKLKDFNSGNGRLCCIILLISYCIIL